MPAIVRDGHAVEMFPGTPFVDAGDIQRPSNWLEFASAEDRLQAGVLDIVEPPAAPEGKVIRALGLDVVDGFAIRTFVMEDAPAPPAPAPFTVFKADIWRRCTDEEAVALDEALSAQPVRLRRMFNDASMLRSDDEMFAQVQVAVTQLLGSERAAVILAASA